MQVYVNNVSGVSLVQVSLLLIGLGFRHFFRYRPLLHIGWRMICKFYANAGGKLQIQRQPLLVQYKQQANPPVLGIRDILVRIHTYD